MAQNLESASLIPPAAPTVAEKLEPTAKMEPAGGSSSSRCRGEWLQSPRLEPASICPHASLREAVESDSEDSSWIPRILMQIQELTGAERVFLFDVRGSSFQNPQAQSRSARELGDCLVSLDYDREPVSKPETRIPRPLFLKALRENQPVWALNALADFPETQLPNEIVSKVRGFAIIPLAVRQVCHAVIYFEHRFQPIEISPQEARRLVFLLRLLSIRHALEKLEKENRSLWLDLLKQRQENYKAVSTAPALVHLAKSPASGREHLIGNYQAIIGSSPAMEEIFQLLDRIRTSKAPVLINGESGTGKELIANAIHKNSPRGDRPFVSENCGALTETLLESELFGYVKGAFTGAHRDHKGLFELADGGTLFLDEVGDMSPAMQKKLLRAIQEEKIRRVGGKDTIPVDVRLISATNKDLLKEVQSGNFREDLYYRLNVINIRLPALRERREDIAELVYHFLAQLSKETGMEKTISPQALQLLIQHPWPGNIRELQNEVKRLFALSDNRIEVANLSPAILSGGGKDQLLGSFEKELLGLSLREALEKVERALVKKALIEAHGNKSQVAKQLQIPKTSLYNKITKYQLDREIQETLFD
ncbi:MAG: sigma-54-dependent Fis family transcriptional regulator [Planctomycetes bacterium]|nr:sigma-54-dependent Fis family transcriptional regulator [Planctomycetota bacterium]